MRPRTQAESARLRFPLRVESVFFFVCVMRGD
jgi:hypothetical protein